ncbi:MAG: hypothetical protein ABI551_27725 [Polyangiaceae bacterium]
MATKAEQFKSETQRATRPKKKKAAKKTPRNLTVDTAKPGTSATDRKVGAGSSGRNLKKKARKGAALETSETGKASRKSTRASNGRVKRDSNLQRRATRKTTSSKAKAERAQAAKR